MNEYIIRRLPAGETLPDLTSPFSEAWKNCPAAPIANYIWDVNGYKPACEAKVMYDESGLYVYMCACEDKVRAVMPMRGMVCTDSCLEFFLQADIARDMYVNIETNPLGNQLIGLGKDRWYRFECVQLPLKDMEVKHSVTDPDAPTGGKWEIAYRITAEWLEMWFGVKPESGLIMRGNFYKCGDKSEFAHYGSWNPVSSARPDFHRPESFGKLILE